MAKKTTKKQDRLADRAKTDHETIKRIKGLGTSVVKESLALNDPFVDIPTRSIGNVSYNKKNRMLEMGSATQRRNLFNLSQAKKFMQTVLLAESCQDLVNSEKTLSLRGMYYKTLHTILRARRKRPLMGRTSRTAFWRISKYRSIRCARTSTSLPRSAARWSANITVEDNGDEINCQTDGDRGGTRFPRSASRACIKFRQVRSEVRSARRERHRLEPLQRRPVLGEPTTASLPKVQDSRHEECGVCFTGSTSRTRASDLLPARLRSVGALHLLV